MPSRSEIGRVTEEYALFQKSIILEGRPISPEGPSDLEQDLAQMEVGVAEPLCNELLADALP